MVLQTKYLFVDRLLGVVYRMARNFYGFWFLRFFPAIGKNKFPQIEITANIFFRKNVLRSKYIL